MNDIDDDVIYWGQGATDLLNTLELVLERLEEVGLYAAAHNASFSRLNHLVCERVLLGASQAERLTGLATMRRPEAAGELMHFLQGDNLLCPSLPRIGGVTWSLRVFLEEHLPGAKRRTKRVASNRAISAGK